MHEYLSQCKAEVFGALAHPTRVAILELLRDHGETSDKSLFKELDLEQSGVRQHLAILRDNHIVAERKIGNRVHYSLQDPLFGEVLDILKKLFTST